MHTDGSAAIPSNNTCALQPRQDDLTPLEDDCKLLGSLLDDCLRVEIGETMFKKVSRGSCYMAN